MINKYEARHTEEEVLENEKVLAERLAMYKREGLDFMKSRDFIMSKANLSKRRVLDVGTGRGLSSICLAEAGHMVTSIDLEDEMLRTASLNISLRKLDAKISLYKMDAFSMDFEEDNFGAVFVVEALHHIEDVDALMKEIDRVLLSSGTAVISDFNEKGMAIVDKVHKKEGHEHMKFNTGPEKVREWMENNGYFPEVHEDNCHWVLIGRKG